MPTNLKKHRPKGAHRPGARSDSTEDHLERIQELVASKGYARVTELAEVLGLSRSTVSNMVRRLAARGYVNYERYRGFTLSAAGKLVAEDIRARHDTLSDLFELMGLEPTTVTEEVEDIEHHLRPQTLAAFASLVRYWRSHPGDRKSFLKFHRKSDSELQKPSK